MDGDYLINQDIEKMTDEQFQKLLNKVAKSLEAYHELLAQAREEYKRRFGSYPNDVDDDFWIDSFEVTASGATVEQVINHAKS